MSRAAIRKAFVTGLVLAVAGAILLLLTMRGAQAQNSTAFDVGAILLAVGGLLQLVSWVLAILSSAFLGRWGWFVALLLLGLIGLVVPIMIIYSVIGPSGRRVAPRRAVAG